MGTGVIPVLEMLLQDYPDELTDLSIGRLADGAWALTVPTFGSANRAAQVGTPTNLRLNEWLALGVTPFNSDFVELYNPDPQPVALGGLHLTDDLNNRTKHRIAALSFLGTRTNAWQKFVADNNTGAGAGFPAIEVPGARGGRPSQAHLHGPGQPELHGRVQRPGFAWLLDVDHEHPRGARESPARGDDARIGIVRLLPTSFPLGLIPHCAADDCAFRQHWAPLEGLRAQH